MPGVRLVPKPQLILFAEECPEHSSPSPAPWRELCRWSLMAVISHGGPAELPAVLSVPQREYGVSACEKGRACSLCVFPYCPSFLTPWSLCWGCLLILGRGLWVPRSGPLLASSMLFLKNVLDSWVTESTAPASWFGKGKREVLIVVSSSSPWIGRNIMLGSPPCLWDTSCYSKKDLI